MISGNGTNLQRIIDEIKSKKLYYKISLVVSNKKNAYGLVRARENNIPTLYLPYIRSKYKNREEYDIKLANSIKSSYYLFHYDKLAAITLTEKSALLKADEISELNIVVFVPITEIPDA